MPHIIYKFVTVLMNLISIKKVVYEKHFYDFFSVFCIASFLPVCAAKQSEKACQ